MSLDTRELRDPKAMRALAHPTRVTLLELLVREGPLTATRAGELLGESPASASFHLRQLAKYGFVVEARGGRGRERPWRIAAYSHRWLDDPAEPAATLLSTILAERNMARLAEWFERMAEEDKAWQDASTVLDSILYLTPEELHGLGAEILALAQRYVGRTAEPSQRPEGSRAVSLLGYAFPLEPTPAGN
jgi:DNA-binding transcriptional ArsR family regulator